MKAYTDLEQSKKLAEILPLESADMAWCSNSYIINNIKGVNYTDEYSANLYTIKEMQECFDKVLNGWDKYWKLIPCWSLAALLDVLSKKSHSIDEDGTVSLSSYKNIEWNCGLINSVDLEASLSSNPVDACYKVIIKLHELNLL